MNMINFKQYIDEGRYDTASYKAIFTAGSPGSGKSYVLDKAGLSSFGFKTINNDIAYVHLLNKASLPTTPSVLGSPRGQYIRSQAELITHKRSELYKSHSLGNIIDGTGKDSRVILARKKHIENLGYECMMIFVDTDLETAKRRNAQRSRSLPDNILEDAWKRSHANINIYKQRFKHFILVDNSDDQDIKAATTKIYKQVMKWVKS